MTKAAFSDKPFDQMVKDQFFAATEIGFAQTSVDPLPQWRRQGTDGKADVPIYLGPANGAAHQRALAHKEDIERTAKNLRKLGRWFWP